MEFQLQQESVIAHSIHEEYNQHTCFFSITYKCLHVQAYHFEHPNEVYIINSILKRNIDCIVLSLPLSNILEILSICQRGYYFEVSQLLPLAAQTLNLTAGIHITIYQNQSTRTREVCVTLILFNITSWLGSKKLHLDIPCSWEKIVPKLVKTHCHHSATFTKHHNQHLVGIKTPNNLIYLHHLKGWPTKSKHSHYYTLQVRLPKPT